jgi:hypothetical protein
MEQFTNIKPDGSPVLEVVDNTTGKGMLLQLDYENPNENIFKYKFRLTIPKNEKHSVSIAHSYSFMVSNKSLITPPSQALTSFFSRLILTSIMGPSKEYPKGIVELDADLIHKAVERVLFAGQN